MARAPCGEGRHLRQDNAVADVFRVTLDPGAGLATDAADTSFDLPAGGRRMNQRAEGYDATIVSGEVIYRNGEATGALPGRLVRAH